MTPHPARALCALALLAGVAGAVQGSDEYGPWYFGFGVGITFTDDSHGFSPGSAIEFAEGYSLNGLVGYENPGFLGSESLSFNVELEAFFSDQSLDTEIITEFSSKVNEFTELSFLVNGVIEKQINDSISFYAGAGIGLATILDLDSVGNEVSSFKIEDDTAFVWQTKIGIHYDLAGSYGAFAQWRHFETEDLATSDATLGQTFDLEIAQDAFEFGVRWYAGGR